jgi:ABC-type siderophore export system fused ATPase/permease subunit
LLSTAGVSLICTEGMNFIPKGEMTKREYLERYRGLVKAVFSPEAYFERIVPAVLALRGISHRAASRLVRRHVGTFLREIYHLGIRGQGYRALFWKAFLRVLWKNPTALEAFGHDCFYFYHLNRHADFVDGQLSSYLSSPAPDDVLDEVVPDDTDRTTSARTAA